MTHVKWACFAIIGLGAAQAAHGGFEYSYANPQQAHADDYIHSTNGVVISQQSPVTYWQVAAGGAPTRTGTIIKRFAFAAPVQNANLLSNAPTFHWSYGNGHNKMYGSTNGANWQLMLDITTPAFGQGNGGFWNGDLPAWMLGGHELWFKWELTNYSIYPTSEAFRNTAQFSRGNLDGSGTAFRLRVNQNPSGIPGGGGTTFDPGPGVVTGDPGAETSNLSQLHRLSAQSVAGSARVERSNTIRRSFTFANDAGTSDPTEVFVTAILDGRLLADNQGRSSVDALFRLLDAAGNPVPGASDSWDHLLTTNLGEQSDVMVHETLGFSALLTPGMTYYLESELSIMADANGFNGAGRAFFDNTFEVILSGQPIPEPASLALLGLGATPLIRRRRP